LYLDNLKVLLVAAIIAMHAVLGYAGTVQVWTYTQAREITLAPVTEVVLLVAVSPVGFFIIALLFLVAGLLTPPSLERKGAGRFVRDRLLRLGVPFTVYVLLVQPAVVYALEHPLGLAPGSYWYELLGEERALDTGPLWFVGVLLIFSLAYAAWVRLRPTPSSRQPPSRITAGGLLLVAAVVAPASFLIRLVYPYGGESGFADLNLWEWPGCAAAFGLGIVAARQGWITAVPDRLYRQSRILTGALIAVLAAFLLTVGYLDKVDQMMGGRHLAAAGFAVIESLLTLFGPVCLLGLARRHLDRPLRLVGPAVRRSAFAAFILQTPVLIGLAVALRPLPLAAEVKAIVVAAGGVTASFALAGLLIKRIPGISHVL
jgi:hypothetical protein